MIFDLQKASLWKRISAALFDFIILSIVVMGVLTVFSGVLGYEEHLDTYAAKCEYYAQLNGVEKFPVYKEEFDKMPLEDQENYKAAEAQINADKEAVKAYQMTQQLPLLMVTGSMLIGILILQVFVPLLFGNGQSLGKKIFGIALMRVDGVKLSNVQLFVRSVLGKFTIEWMIPIYILIMMWLGKGGIFSLAILALLLIAQILCLVITRTGSFLHDVMAGTVAVDMASQMIFETKEAQIKYIKEAHAKQVAETPY